MEKTYTFMSETT